MPSTQNLPPSPECDRLVAAAPYSHKIGEFIDWLRETKHWHIAEVAEDDEVSDDPTGLARIVSAHPHGDLDLHPARYSTEKLLAEFFAIDLDKIEDERRAMLDALRQQQ